MATDIFSIGISGLRAAQTGLITAGHNISNASTPGFNRQQVLLANATPLASGDGFYGNGVRIDGIARIYSQFLDNEAQTATAQSGTLDIYYGQLRQLDNLLADPSAGLTPALQEFFSALQDVATFPNSVPSRQSLLSNASVLAARFATIDQRMTELSDGLNSDVVATAQEISDYATQIADLNQRIIVAQGASGGQPPNDLMDQRDHLVELLNKDVRATVVRQDDGAYNVFIGNGQPLVAGILAFELRTMRDPLDPTRMTLAYPVPGGQVQVPEGAITGGRLGGLLAFRTETLDPAQNELGRVAVTLADTFNAQHVLGQDLNGQPGGAFFSVGAPRVSPSTLNTGNAVIGATVDSATIGALTASDYRLDYDGANYTLTRLSDNTQQVYAALPQTVDGFTISLAAGAAAAGDKFLIRPTVNGGSTLNVAITDPTKVAAAAPIRTARAGANTGTGTISAGTVNTLDPNLQQPVTITFTSPTTFDVTGTGTGNPTGVAYTAGQNISFNGWTLQISGAPAAGDTFSVGPNGGGAGDNRNALALVALQTRKILDGGTASYQSAYSSLVGDIGTKTHQFEVTSAAQATILEQAKTARESFSGVNLDEEAANLMRFQQAYQASGKMLQIASTLFDSILQLGK